MVQVLIAEMLKSEIWAVLFFFGLCDAWRISKGA